MIQLTDTCKNFANYLNTIYTYDYFYPNHTYLNTDKREDIYAQHDKRTENAKKYYNTAYNLCVAIEGAFFTEGIYTAFKDPDFAETIPQPNKKISIYADDNCLDFITNFMDFYGDIKTNVTKEFFDKSTYKIKTDKDGNPVLPKAYINRLNDIYDSIKDFVLFGFDYTEYEIMADSIENINMDGTGRNYWSSGQEYGGSLSVVEQAVVGDRFDFGTHYCEDDTARIATVYFSLLCYNNGLFFNNLQKYADEHDECLEGEIWYAEKKAYENLKTKYPDTYSQCTVSDSAELHECILNDDTTALLELKNVVDHFQDYNEERKIG